MRVYPRVCGGTLIAICAGRVNEGLSPRVRGNPQFANIGCAPVRSIPACAGEPAARENYDDDDEVYPRVCGGTRHSANYKILYPGLSPRVRGNL